MWGRYNLIRYCIYICIMYVRYIYIYHIYHIIRCLQTKMLMISFLALIFFLSVKLDKTPGTQIHFFLWNARSRTGNLMSQRSSRSGCPSLPIGRLVQEEKLRHLGSNAVKTGCSCLDGFENSRAQPCCFFCQLVFRGEVHLPLFFSPLFFRENIKHVWKEHCSHRVFFTSKRV